MHPALLLVGLAVLYGMKKRTPRGNGNGESGKISIKGAKVVYDFGSGQRGQIIRKVVQQILDEAGARNYWKIYDKYHTPPWYRWQWRFTPHKGHWYGMTYSYHKDVYINIEYPVKHSLEKILRTFKAIPEFNGDPIFDYALSEKIELTWGPKSTTWQGG